MTLPTSENVERARAFREKLESGIGVKAGGAWTLLASEFAQSDAIARRRAIEEAMAECLDESRTLAILHQEDASRSAASCYRRIRAWRPPTVPPRYCKYCPFAEVA